MEELLILVEAVTQIINQEEAIALGMEVRQVMSITEEIRERMVAALIVQALQTILIMLVLEEMELLKVHILTLVALTTVDIITLVLLEQVVAQTMAGQVEVVTLHQEVHQIAGREAHLHRVHQAGVVVVLLQVVAEHQEARLAVVEVAAVAAAVDQDN